MYSPSITNAPFTSKLAREVSLLRATSRKISYRADVSSKAVTSTVTRFLPGCKSVPPVITYVACTSLVVTTTATDFVSAGRETSPSIYSVPSMNTVAPVSFGLFATSRLTS